MKRRLCTALALLSLTMATPALAQDAAAGEKEFGKCKACHSITAPDGTAIFKGGKTGPDLYGIIGRTVGSEAAFAPRYKDSIKAVGETGLVWDEAELAAYMTDPKAWLNEKLGVTDAKTGMTWKQKAKQADIAAYLAAASAAN